MQVTDKSASNNPLSTDDSVNSEMREALSFALECLLRPGEVDPPYRLQTILMIKAALKKAEGVE